LRRFVRLLGFAVLAILAVPVGAVTIDGVQTVRRNARARALDDDLREQVPPGSSRGQAEAWFTSHGITPLPVSMLGSRDHVRLFSRLDDATLLCVAKLDISVSWDANGLVTETRVERSNLSP
jgi:hypothetical protein